MKKIKKTIAVRLMSAVSCASFFLLFSGCFGSNENNNQEQDAVASEKKSSFYISIPDDWERFSEEELRQYQVEFGAREPTLSSQIESGVSISRQSYSSAVDLDRYVNRSLDQVRLGSQNYYEVNRENVSLEMGSGVLVEYRDRSTIDLSEIGFYSLYTKDDHYVYTVTMLFDPKTSDDHKAFLRSVITTFNNNAPAED